MIGRSVFRKSGAGIKPVRARRFDAGRSGVPSVHRSEATGLEDEMNFKWVGPVVLLAALFIGDQIRINRPGHKYRLTVEVETPQGRKSASSVLAVHPDRGYSRGGHTRTVGDAVFVDLGGGKNLIALLVHLDGKLDFDGINYLALRAYTAAGGKRASFNEMNRLTGTVAVKVAMIPELAGFTDSPTPSTPRPHAHHALPTVLDYT